ncbi:retrotransposon protein, putative, ty1-copia subclass, partial [Tanacetum coccineum]
GYIKKDDQPSSSGSIYDDSEVMTVMSAEALLDLIMNSGCSYHMTPRYIPELKRNLISLGTLEKEGYTVKLQSGKIKLINGSRIVLSGTRRDNCVYFLDGHAVAGELNASVEEKDSLEQVWHKRLGHISEAGLHVLEKQGLFGNKSLGKLDFYENFVLGNSHRVSFGVGKAHYSGSDKLCAFRLMGSISGGIIRRFKHEAFGKFKEWKQLVENQTGRTGKKMRTNNGLEFCNREFEHLCVESRIARHLTVTGTPWQNRLADRMNRTLIDKIWSGHPSDYGMLRTFDCIAYSHIKQGKLEPRAKNYILLGYPHGVKGYKLYRLDNESPKIVTNRNEVFNENVMYKDTLKDSGACADKSVEELQVKVELQRLNNHTLEKDQIDQEDGDDEDAGDQETDQTSDLTGYQLVRDREPKIRMKPLRFRDESNMKAAMEEEMDSLRKNKTWELVDYTARQKLVSCTWLFKIKEGIEGVQKPRYKSRFVARGFTHRTGIDYNEVFSPVVRHISIRVILALTACKDYELEQLDVKMAFLHGNLKEMICMRQSPGYEQGNKVYDRLFHNTGDDSSG